MGGETFSILNIVYVNGLEHQEGDDEILCLYVLRLSLDSKARDRIY